MYAKFIVGLCDKDMIKPTVNINPKFDVAEPLLTKIKKLTNIKINASVDGMGNKGPWKLPSVGTVNAKKADRIATSYLLEIVLPIMKDNKISNVICTNPVEKRVKGESQPVTIEKLEAQELSPLGYVHKGFSK